MLCIVLPWQWFVGACTCCGTALYFSFFCLEIHLPPPPLRWLAHPPPNNPPSEKGRWSTCVPLAHTGLAGVRRKGPAARVTTPTENDPPPAAPRTATLRLVDHHPRL